MLMKSLTSSLSQSCHKAWLQQALLLKFAYDFFKFMDNTRANAGGKDMEMGIKKFLPKFQIMILLNINTK